MEDSPDPTAELPDGPRKLGDILGGQPPIGETPDVHRRPASASLRDLDFEIDGLRVALNTLEHEGQARSDQYAETSQALASAVEERARRFGAN